MLGVLIGSTLKYRKARPVVTLVILNPYPPVACFFFIAPLTAQG
jgi:hypothetical protein